jgi:Na+/H+ antiporter NhaD/arsenite permease-like protein
MLIFLNCFLDIISVTIIALILDKIGLFRWCVLTLAFTAEGNRKKLFAYLITLVVSVSLFFNNLAAVLILVPIVLMTLRKLKITDLEMLPFLFACNIIPDIAGIITITGNPISLISFQLLDTPLRRYISVVFILCMIALIAQTMLMFIYFRNHFKHKYSTSYILNPDDEVIDWNGLNFGLFLVFFMFVGHMVALSFNIPTSIISIASLMVLLFYSRKMLSFSGIIGNVIGAKFIPIGSISTIVWFHIIRVEGIKISLREYIFSTLTLVLPILLLVLVILRIMI